jgi:ribosomal silencing factor RsfS
MLHFFKQVEAIVVESESGRIGSRLALNIVDRLEKKMSKTEAEILLERLQSERWILLDVCDTYFYYHLTLRRKKKEHIANNEKKRNLILYEF